MDDDQRPYALVVDDDPAIRLGACDILEEAGFRTIDAENGDAAWPLLLQQHASIVLLFTDVQMPGSLDGFALARKTAALWPEIAVVVASGQISPEPGELPAGATFIGKPFSADLVHGRLREFLPDGRKPDPLR